MSGIMPNFIVILLAQSITRTETRTNSFRTLLSRWTVIVSLTAPGEVTALETQWRIFMQEAFSYKSTNI